MTCHHGLNAPFCSLPNLHIYIVIWHVLFKNKQFCNWFFVLFDGDIIFFILESPTVTLVETIDKIGVVGVAVIWKEVNSVNSQRNSSHSKWSEKDRYSIGKYTSENGVAAVVRKFKSKFPPWTEALCALFEKRLTQNWRKLQRKKESQIKLLQVICQLRNALCWLAN